MIFSDVLDGAEEEEEDEEPVEDLLKPGHLTRLLEEELAAEVEALCVGNVGADSPNLLLNPSPRSPTCKMINSALLTRLNPCKRSHTSRLGCTVFMNLA